MEQIQAKKSQAISLLPIALLTACGFMFAGRIMISKAGLDAGADPFQLGVFGNLGAAFLLSIWLIARKEKIAFDRRSVLLYIVLGILTAALPTILSFFVVLHVGPAYTSTVYSLSPILTMSFAAGLGVEKMTMQRSIGILLGLLGMLALVQQQLVAINYDQTIWIIAGICIPLSTALGNIIRTAFWPKGASARSFACASLFTSCIIMATLSLFLSEPNQWVFNKPAIGFWLGVYILASASSYVLNFSLQGVAGPVVFSQTAYWGTGFGVLLAALLFGDVLTSLSLIGLALVITGGVLATRKRRA